MAALPVITIVVNDIHMRRRIQICLLALLILALGTPAFAQVSKVTADAKGIT